MLGKNAVSLYGWLSMFASGYVTLPPPFLPTPLAPLTLWSYSCGVCYPLKLMSEATQAYLKRVLGQLATVAWQRRGGLSEDLLRGGCLEGSCVACVAAKIPRGQPAFVYSSIRLLHSCFWKGQACCG